MDFLILKDETKIQIEPGSSLSNIQVVFLTKDELISTWDKMTNENLKQVQIESNGNIIANYTNLVLVDVKSSEQQDSTIKSIFNLREKTETELLREEVALLKAGYEIHDGAISDLGTVVSEITGGV